MFRIFNRCIAKSTKLSTLNWTHRSFNPAEHSNSTRRFTAIWSGVNNNTFSTLSHPAFPHGITVSKNYNRVISYAKMQPRFRKSKNIKSIEAYQNRYFTLVSLSLTFRPLAFKWAIEKLALLGPGFGWTEPDMNNNILRLVIKTTRTIVNDIGGKKTIKRETNLKQLKSPIAALYWTRLSPINKKKKHKNAHHLLHQPHKNRRT